MTGYAIVFVGAGLGGSLRHAVNLAAARLLGPVFPWGTLTVNVAGSFLMGLLAGWLAVKAGQAWSEQVRLLVGTGILGGFTTFSAFSLDAMILWERGQPALSAAYVIASVLLSIAGLAAGLALSRVVA
jgi:fluoride exporter